MMNYVIFDLEATCWQDSTPLQKMEMIEIGAVMLDGKSYQAVSDFEHFVKPSINPELSDFCINLTGIKQNKINTASDYKTVFGLFLDWIGEGSLKLCSWGKFDNDLFKIENKRINAAFPKNFKGHINLKELYSKAFNAKPSIGLMEALHKRNMTFQGKHHRGIDDARNIARIAQMILVLD